ncbi:MAG: prenyltransferase [Halofilum sp. (in: g-proteobacteria)]|nr:prenyltransferase [Halofilum sp. (in: g-proteobacteria)]
MKASIAVLAGTARPGFLLLTPVCVFLGIAASTEALREPASYAWLLLALAGAVFAHMSVNMLNEYEDFTNGLDLRTERTPFSGGSGSLPEAPTSATLIRNAGALSLAITLVIGLVLVHYRGSALLPLGLLGLVLVGSYSTHIVRWPLASLIAPGLGFGPLMVMGTSFVVSGHYSQAALVASLVPLFLVSGLLLLNQFPDVEADRSVGRSNLPIRLGRRRSSVVFALLLAAAYGSIAAGMMTGELPWAAAIALLPGLGAPWLAVGVYRHADDVERLVPMLGWNVGLTLATPLLLGLGMLVA